MLVLVHLSASVHDRGVLYNSGERVGLPSEVAAALIAQGIATRVEDAPVLVTSELDAAPQDRQITTRQRRVRTKGRRREH